MKPIDHLDRVRRTAANALGVELTPIPAGQCDGWMAREPGCDTLSRAIGQQVQHAMIDQVDEDRAVLAAAPPGPLVDSHGDWGRCCWKGGTAHQAPQRGRAGLIAQPSGESRTGLATKR
jgi:hypothetical protein